MYAHIGKVSGAHFNMSGSTEYMTRVQIMTKILTMTVVAMAELVATFGWEYISVVYEESSYGTKVGWRSWRSGEDAEAARQNIHTDLL